MPHRNAHVAIACCTLDTRGDAGGLSQGAVRVRITRRRPSEPLTDDPQGDRQAGVTMSSGTSRHTAVNPPSASGQFAPASELRVDLQEAQHAMETMRTADDVILPQAVERAVTAMQRLKRHQLYYHAVSDKQSLQAQGAGGLTRTPAIDDPPLPRHESCRRSPHLRAHSQRRRRLHHPSLPCGLRWWQSIAVRVCEGCTSLTSVWLGVWLCARV
jgi:hypothetical protein